MIQNQHKKSVIFLNTNKHSKKEMGEKNTNYATYKKYLGINLT